MDKLMSVEMKALGRALAVSFILCILVATVIYFTGLRETLLASLGKIILTISVFWAGSYVSKFYGSKGLVRGITMGVLFFILMLIATLVFNKSVISLGSFFYSLAVCVVAGGLGGILGIGLSNN